MGSVFLTLFVIAFKHSLHQHHGKQNWNSW